MTATDLIAHLESGGLIATGHPDRASYLKLEIRNNPQPGQERVTIERYGWGSALATNQSWLEDAVLYPNRWVKVEAKEICRQTEDMATGALEKIGKFSEEERWYWEVTARDERPGNLF